MAITQNTYTGNGSTTNYSFTFPYLETTDIKVSVNGVNTTAYTLANATTISFNTAPANGAAIRIYRDTDDAALSATFYPGSAIRSQDLNDNFTQNLYVVQEINNNAVQIDGSQTMVGDLDMGGYQINNLASPTADTDAVNRAYVNNIVANGIGDGDKGDIIVSGSGSTLTIDASSVTNSKVASNASIVSSKLAFTQSGTGAVQRTVEAKLQDVVSVKDFGAVGDGVTDDTVAIQAALTAASLLKKLVHLPVGTYKVSSRITVPSNTGLVSSERAKLYATAAGFNNTSLTNKYAVNSCVIDLSGLVGSPFTAATNQILHGFVIESEVSDGRFVDAVVSRNCSNLEISNVEIFGFPVTRAICLASVIRGSVFNNYIHDCTTNSSYGATPQITGIEIDNDRVNSIYSKSITVANNKINSLTFGSSALSLYGYQTDGINIAGASSDITVQGNVIDTVGEGIDTYGSDSVISDNTIRNTYLFGIKLIHGASRNTVANNSIYNTGIAGIVLAGSNVAGVGDIASNLIDGNFIAGIDYLGVWSGGDTGGIKIDNITYTYKPLNNLVSNNVIASGGKYGLVTTSLASNIFDGNHIPYTPSVARTSSPLYSVRDANPTRLKATVDATQSIPASTWTKVNFGTRAFDTRSELDTTNKRWVCQVGGVYSIAAQVRTPSYGTFMAEVAVRKNGSNVLRTQSFVGSANDATRLVSGLVACEVGEYLEVFFWHNYSSNIDISAASDLSFFNVFTS